MLLCPAIRMIVKASTPDSPSLVSIVWRSECRTKSPGKRGRRLPLIFGAQMFRCRWFMDVTRYGLPSRLEKT